jgi:UrcA family protein
MNRKLVALFAAAVAFTSTSAIAAPQTLVREAVVNYADLDLESAAGIEALYTRLRAAARNVCGSADTKDMAAHQNMKQCREIAIASAVSKIGNAALAAHHSRQPEARFAQATNGARG